MRRLETISHHLLGAAPMPAMQATGTNAIAPPLRICVTGAAGQLAYSLILLICEGSMTGTVPIELTLLEIPEMMPRLQGVLMEIEDGSFPNVMRVTAHSDPLEAFRDIDVACLVGSFPRKAGMERKELLQKNADIFRVQGAALDRAAKRTVKVIVVGNPANTNALITLRCAPSLPRESFTALTRLDQNRAQAMLATHARLPPGAVRNVIIWGNHSATLVPDVSHAVASDPTALSAVLQAPDARKWLQEEYYSNVQQRGAAVIKARAASSAASAGKAVCDHMRAWLFGTAPGEIVSMGILSKGDYGVAEGIVYSFPCTVEKGVVKVVPGWKIDNELKERMKKTEKELLEEKETALAFLNLK